MAAGGMGPRAVTASCFIALLSFSRASGTAEPSNRAVGCSWGVPRGRGARFDVRRVWGVGAVVPIAAGGVDLRAFTASYSFALLSFARVSGGTRASGRAAGCSWGVPWGQGARVEVRQIRFAGGVVPMTAGGMGPRAFAASCSLALVSFVRASEGRRASDRAAGCPWGVPRGRGARVEVRRVWGVGGVVPMAAGGVGPRAFTASCSFALLSFARAPGRPRGSGSVCWLLLGSAMGPRCAC